MSGLQTGLVLLLCYAILAWQLRPIKTLQRAVMELGKGNLNYRIRTNDSGEFGVLSEGFNEMAQQFSDMIKAKEELLLGVSHELRSPLASANVLLELIDDEKRRGQIRHHLHRMDALISELLESHRIASAHATPEFEMCSVEEVLRKLKSRYPEAGLEMDIPASDVIAEFDRRYFDRLLTNLIENALKYSKDSGIPVRISLSETTNSFRVDVIDAGPGIPATDLANIFEPFFRVDKSRNKATGGFGLGLYLCAKIAHMHQGQITATNRLPHGAQFTVVFPKKQTPRALRA